MKHNTSLLSGALAFYALLSLAPALYFIVAAAGAFSGRGAAQGELMVWATQMLGPGGARFIGGFLDRDRTGRSFATIAGIASLLFGATGAFGALQDALNMIWEVPSSGRGFIKQFFFKRLISFVAVMFVGVLLLVALLTGAMISAAGRFIPQALPMTEFILQAVTFAVTLALVTALFAMLYRLLPDSAVAWHDVWTGSTVTALLFLDWKDADRIVSGAFGIGLSVWGSQRIGGGVPVMDVLLRPDFPLWRRIHRGLRRRPASR